MNNHPPLRTPNRKRTEGAIRANNAINHANHIIDPKQNIKKGDFEKPSYGSAEYQVQMAFGIITREEYEIDKTAYDKETLAAINNSIKINLDEDDRISKMKAPRQNGDYIPELNSCIYRDKRLNKTCTDILLFLMENVNKWGRGERAFQATKTYIANAVEKSTSSVYRGLKRLQQCGYINRIIIASAETRMCDGLMIFVNSICFPKHRRKQRVIEYKKNKNGRKQGTAKMKQKYKKYILKKEKSAYITVEEWSMKIFNGLYRAKKKLLD